MAQKDLVTSFSYTLSRRNLKVLHLYTAVLLKTCCHLFIKIQSLFTSSEIVLVFHVNVAVPNFYFHVLMLFPLIWKKQHLYYYLLFILLNQQFLYAVNHCSSAKSQILDLEFLFFPNFVCYHGLFSLLPFRPIQIKLYSFLALLQYLTLSWQRPLSYRN